MNWKQGYDENGDPNPIKTKKKGIHPEVSKFFAMINKKKGFCAWSKAKRSVVRKQHAAKGWETRRRKYGWQGRRIRKQKKTPRQVAESVMIQNPDLIGHPVWKES